MEEAVENKEEEWIKKYLVKNGKNDDDKGKIIVYVMLRKNQEKNFFLLIRKSFSRERKLCFMCLTIPSRVFPLSVYNIPFIKSQLF